MLVRRITAHAFGPFTEQTLTFADGMTVVYGPNESGKSSWRAAIYAALCGRRRAKGRQAADQRYTALHRPWDGDRWLVSAEIALADGRRVELRNDLDGKVDCHAIDLDLGTDYSSEIMFGGSPDASVWLGLDRDSFAATAAVTQAQIMSVLDSASALQDHLQRAATSARADETAATALARLEAFRADNVGRDQANSVKPLRRASQELRQAERDVQLARTQHSQYEQRLGRLGELRLAAAQARSDLGRHESARLAALARRLRARYEEAQALQARLSGIESVTDQAAVAERSAGERAAPAAMVSEQVGSDASVDLARAALRRARGRRSMRRALLLVALLLGFTAAAAFAVLEPTWITPALLGGGLIGAAVVVATTAWMVGRRSDPAVAQADLEAALAAAGAAAGRSDRDRAWQHQQVRSDEQRLRVLLDRRSLSDLKDEAAQAADQADAAIGLLAGGSSGRAELEPGEVADEALAEAQVAQLRQRERAAADAVLALESSLAERAQSLPLVGEAEERVARAGRELDRVRRLDQTLELTASFLAAAQERAHRSIAPVLAQSVRRWLTTVTDGRYTDVIVDPRTLRVQVCGADRRWRGAEQLSHGTAEQIYLLLRLALVDRLTRPGESCPMLLDDVTVHADASRRVAMLNLLQSISRERQVILFTQQESVRDWAAAHFDGIRDLVAELAPPGKSVALIAGG